MLQSLGLQGCCFCCALSSLHISVHTYACRNQALMVPVQAMTQKACIMSLPACCIAFAICLPFGPSMPIHYDANVISAYHMTVLISGFAMQFEGNSSLPNEGMAEYNQSTIYNIFLMPPNKAEALAYLDGSGAAPGRYARAIVIRGAEAVPDTMEYQVDMSCLHQNMLGRVASPKLASPSL